MGIPAIKYVGAILARTLRVMPKVHGEAGLNGFVFVGCWWRTEQVEEAGCSVLIKGCYDIGILSLICCDAAYGELCR